MNIHLEQLPSEAFSASSVYCVSSQRPGLVVKKVTEIKLRFISFIYMFYLNRVAFSGQRTKLRTWKESLEEEEEVFTLPKSSCVNGLAKHHSAPIKKSLMPFTSCTAGSRKIWLVCSKCDRQKVRLITFHVCFLKVLCFLKDPFKMFSMDLFTRQIREMNPTYFGNVLSRIAGFSLLLRWQILFENDLNIFPH